ncbi:DUF4331 domain-containing protein [Nonomuraea sp. NBC_00507]|uniref:DUF4331 family protein n=1 Tax=Nonomuraea sp. NBC_00507 TaxID=2976002 RepID=UPI002E17DCD8
MSHHTDIPESQRDITDVYCFAGNNGTVFVINVSPLQSSGFDPEVYYEFKVDTSSPLDYLEDITWRVTFPGGDAVKVEQLTGRAARDRDATGKVITPAEARLGQVVTCTNGIKLFAGERGEPFFNDPRFTVATRAALSTGTNPSYTALYPAQNAFQNTNVSAIVLEVPSSITGSGTIGYWGNTSVKEHGVWHQLQHAAGPLVGFIWDFSGGSAGMDFNASHPKDHLNGRPKNPGSDPASGFWGQVRDATAAVVAARKTFDDPPQGKATPKAYGAYVADTLLPDVLRFKVGTSALWDPWNKEIQNGKGLTECAPDSMYDLVLNEELTMGLTHKDATGILLDHFPYLSRPVTGG